MSGSREATRVIKAVVIFTGLPVTVLLLRHFPERTLLKESISLLTLLSFFMITGQFFWSRMNRSTRTVLDGKKIKTIHNLIGYTCVTVLCLHPFLLVVPRFMEPGVEPINAFTTIITTISSRGVVLGLIAWVLMFTLGITSVIRNKLPIRYLAWRKLHGMLSVMFIVVAAAHVISLGRHVDTPMTLLIIAFSSYGIVLLFNEYLIQPLTKIGTKQ